MKKLLLALLLALSSSLLTISHAQNINVGNSPYFEGECYLAVNPLNPKHLVGAWIHFSVSNLKDAVATRTSFDGGKTWSPLQTLPHLYPKFTSADPTMYFGKDSCVYFAFIDLSGLKTSDSGYIMVTRSTNGGLTWGTPVKAIGWKDTTNLPIDRPWIAADHSNGPYAGRVYLTTQNAYFTPQPHHPWFSYSTDSGATWSHIKRLDMGIPSGKVTDATAFTTVSANGTFYGAYISYDTALSVFPRMVVVKSSNGGASFASYIAYTYSVSDELPAADTLIKGGFCFSSNPTDSTNLIITEPTNHFGQPDVVSYNTHDAGKTWGSPVRLNDDPVGAYDTCHDLAWGGFAANGIFAATWRDRRNTGRGDTVGFKIYGTTSHDGGNTYTPNFVISDTISPPIMIDHGDDFMGCAVTDSNVYALWSDLRTGKENTWFNSTPFSKIPLGIASITNTPGVRVDAYPNPFHDEVNVVVNSAAPLQSCKLQVFDINGKKMNEMEIPANGTYKFKFNTAPAAGTYLWSLVEQGKAIAQGKWIIE